MSARESAISIDVETLRRFDRPGPRYTSYPTAVQFDEDVDADVYASHLERADVEAPDEALSLYVHLPFCDSRCRFCACNAIATPRMDVALGYLDRLEREVELVAERLPRRRRVAQMHWGGGTPTYYEPERLPRVFEMFADRFALDEALEIAVEVNPHVTTMDHLETLAGLGFNRLSVGVQDLTPEVQEAIGRNQTYEETRGILAAARALGFAEGVNVDLVYGLPRQRPGPFEDSLDRVIELRPDRVALYSFAYVPWMHGHQKRIDPADLPAPEMKLELYLRAMNRFLAHGYEPIGMDHFALPDDELAVAAREGRLNRNFMGYTVTTAPDMLAFGISGIGYVRDAFFQTEKKLAGYYAALETGRLPTARGYVLSRDDRIRQHVIRELMCNFRIGKADVEERFGIDFDAYFADSLARLAELEAAGFVEAGADELRVTPRGRVFVRNVCMAFDRYLERKPSDHVPYSRTV